MGDLVSRVYSFFTTLRTFRLPGSAKGSYPVVSKIRTSGAFWGRCCYRSEVAKQAPKDNNPFIGITV